MRKVQAVEENKKYDKLVNKILDIEDKCTELNKIIKVLDIWIKENGCEMIPVMNILNNKMNEVTNGIKECLFQN